MPVTEFQDRLAAIVAASEWTDDQKANKLIAAAFTKAYAMLRNVVIEGISSAQRFAILKRELLKRFGLTPEKDFTCSDVVMKLPGETQRRTVQTQTNR